MASEDVRIQTEVINGENFIVVNREGIAILSTDFIEYHNELEYIDNGGNSVQVDARITFYPFITRAAKDTPQAIEGFCAEEPDEKTFEVTAGELRICNPTQAGNYLYKIEAAQHHPLDPVVIIDDPGFLAGIAPVIVGIGAAAVATYFSMRLAYRMGRNESMRQGQDDKD